MRRVELMGSMTMVCAGDSFRGGGSQLVRGSSASQRLSKGL